MKKTLTLIGLILLASVSSFANTITYSNNSGCTVDVESRNNGTIYYVSQGNMNEVVGITKDFSAGTFAYCADSALNINFFEGKKGTGILMSCSEHNNDHAITRGRVDISIISGELTEIAIDGQVKKLLGWKQDTKIECKKLVRK